MKKVESNKEKNQALWRITLPLALLIFAGVSIAYAIFNRPIATATERLFDEAFSDPSAIKSGIGSIWAVNDGEKLDRDDLKNPYQAANSVWDGRKIKLFCARNEIVAFQLIVESSPAGINKLSVTLSHLEQKGGNARIDYQPPVSDPTQYVGRPIQLFSENYMPIMAPTEAGWIYKVNTPSAPKNPTGWKPVQLVPENARVGKGGFPLRVEPSQNQAIWIEIYAARRLPAGIYQGRVGVEADGERRDLTIELELFNFTLPDVNSMNGKVIRHKA